MAYESYSMDEKHQSFLVGINFPTIDDPQQDKEFKRDTLSLAHDMFDALLARIRAKVDANEEVYSPDSIGAACYIVARAAANGAPDKYREAIEQSLLGMAAINLPDEKKN